VTERARPEQAGPEEEHAPAAAPAALELTPPGRVLALQRTAGNRAVGQLLARETATKPKTGLERLDELLGKFNVDEDAVIAHLGTLNVNEKAVVLRDYRARIADPLNPREMVRAVKHLDTTLWNKLVWVGAAGTPDYGDIRQLIKDAPDQKQRDALKTDGWRSWFVSVCSNATMKQAVVDLKFDLLTQLNWVSHEMSTNYDDIRALCKADTVTDDDRRKLKTKAWRDWFVDICTNATMRDAVVDLKFDAWYKVQWMVSEGTDNGLLRSALLADGKATDVARVVTDPKLIDWVRSELDADAVRTIDLTYLELAGKEKKEEFGGFADQLTDARQNDLRHCGSRLKNLAATIGDDRFAALAARIMLISKYAPRARREALRVLTAQLSDQETALRMIAKPVQAVIVPRDKMMTDLDEFKSLLTSDSGGGPGNTFDGRPWKHVRGVGNVVVGDMTYAAITEENLLGGVPDASTQPAGTTPAGYATGYSTTSHEFAHVLHRNGLNDKEKKLIDKHYAAKRTATSTKAGMVNPNVWPDGPRVSPTAPAAWVTAGYTDDTWLDKLLTIAEASRKVYENYSSQNSSEYFAQLSNAYLGSNLGTDPTTGAARNNGRAWIVANEDPEMLALLDKVYKRKTVNDIDASGALTAGGLCTNPDPKPAPPPPGPPPGGGGGGP
jgi:hypothetical protein